MLPLRYVYDRDYCYIQMNAGQAFTYRLFVAALSSTSCHVTMQHECTPTLWVRKHTTLYSLKH